MGRNSVCVNRIVCWEGKDVREVRGGNGVTVTMPQCGGRGEGGQRRDRRGCGPV